MKEVVFTNGLKVQMPASISTDDIGAKAVELARQWLDLGAPLAEAVAMAAGVNSGCRWACVSEFKQGSDHVSLLAMTDNGLLVDCFSYQFNRTPCEEVLAQDKFCFFSGVQQTFPEDKDLEVLGVMDYAGKRFTDFEHNVVGHLVLLDDKPMNERQVEQIIFAMVTFLHLEWPQ